jgi:hypothetical protein
MDGIPVKVDARDPTGPAVDAFQLPLYTAWGKKRIISVKSPAEGL